MADVGFKNEFHLNKTDRDGRAFQAEGTACAKPREALSLLSRELQVFGNQLLHQGVLADILLGYCTYTQ